VDVFLDAIKEVVDKNNLFIEERFYEDCISLSFLLIKGHTFNVRITDERTLGMYGEDETTYHELEEIDLDAKFKESFEKFVTRKKIKLMYETRFEKWLSEFSIRLSENGIRCNKEKLKNELNNSFNISDVQQREVFLMKLMLNPLRTIYPYTINNENIVFCSQDGEKIGVIKIKEIEG
jgi:hypothetical protein